MLSMISEERDRLANKGHWRELAVDS
jgi:hypothetical protein